MLYLRIKWENLTGKNSQMFHEKITFFYGILFHIVKMLMLTAVKAISSESVCLVSIFMSGHFKSNTLFKKKIYITSDL